MKRIGSLIMTISGIAGFFGSTGTTGYAAFRIDEIRNSVPYALAEIKGNIDSYMDDPSLSAHTQELLKDANFKLEEVITQDDMKEIIEASIKANDSNNYLGVAGSGGMALSIILFACGFDLYQKSKRKHQ